MSLEISKELEAAKKAVEQLTKELENSRKGLGKLYLEYGFDTVEDFIAELKVAHKSGPAPKVAGTRSKEAAAGVPKKKGKRARITPEIKKAVAAAVKDGKTGQQIAEELGISLPSVQNIKKEFGLVKSRS